MQAKDLDDRIFIEHVRDLGEIFAVRVERKNGFRPGSCARWVNRWDLEARYPDVPPKVVRAKCQALIRRGLLDGCTCGCRGDFELTEKGKTFLAG